MSKIILVATSLAFCSCSYLSFLSEEAQEIEEIIEAVTE